MFSKILIANRGEIAVRIITACKELGIKTVVPYSKADEHSLFVKLADEAYFIGEASSSESYLNIEKIISLALKAKAQAIHPGYGFLSENADFIRKVESAGIKFIGPTPESVELMGEKTAARRKMQNSSVPIVPGSTRPLESLAEALEFAREIGYPVILKAASGGGGKGMRKVGNDEQMQSAFERAKNEALKAFGDDKIYIEKFVENPKHIEVQIIADNYGNVVHLFERECSVQRRHQKIIEESPSPSIDEKTREAITSAAIKAAKAAEYVNAGTIEFLFDAGSKEFYFLEMNTRLQVEHPVTEMVTGIDIVKEQIRIAAGEKLSFSQSEVKKQGHAIECRIYAEDTSNNFMPSTGIIKHYKPPLGPFVRVDAGIDLKSEVTVYYDPMLAKLIVWAENRNSAIARMQRALENYQIVGVVTNIDLLKWILMHQKFVDATFTINFIEEELFPLLPEKWRKELYSEHELKAAVIAAILKERKKALKAKKNKISQFNSWELQNYE